MKPIKACCITKTHCIVRYFH